MVNWSLQFVPDFAVNHLQNNTLLLEGQIGIELDTGKFKIGDGVTPWSNLTFVATGDITSIWMGASTKTGNMLSHSATDGGLHLDPAQFNARNALLAGLTGTHTFANIDALYTSSPHLAATGNIGVIIRSIVSALGSDFANAATAVPTSASLQTRIEDLARDLSTGNFNMTALLRDDLQQTSTTWSSSKIAGQINAMVAAAISNLVGAAPEALNTIYELADFMQANSNMVGTLATEMGLMVKYVAQTLTAEQQHQARANISAAGSADVGPYSDQNNTAFITTFNWVMGQTEAQRAYTNPAIV